MSAVCQCLFAEQTKLISADPKSGDATLGVGGPGPPATDNGNQLSLDRGEEKT
jgi:hypothetical protein